MPPDAMDSEEMERLNVEYQPSHQGRRILPEGDEPVRAWVEQEDRSGGSATNSPGENKRLLGPHRHPPPTIESLLQAGLTLGVPNIPRKHNKYPQTPKCAKERPKTKFEKRKEKLKAILKPPYFILSMIIIIICIHLWLGEAARAKLEWSPGAWRREPWRLLSYGFVHATTTHLALNAIVALFVGWRLEHEQSWWRVCGVWAGGLAAGALGAGALQPRVRVVGASAAVYALLTAHLPNVCFRFRHIPLWWFRPLAVVVLCASEACWGLVFAPAVTSSAALSAAARAHDADHVAWAAHALGAAVGVPLAFLLFNGENCNKTAIKVCRMVSVLALGAGVVAAALHFTIFYDPDAD